MTDPDGVWVREATVTELPDVLNVLDGSGLATDAGRVRRALDGGDALVAVAGEPDDRSAQRILGALVLENREITAVAVRRRRRDQGVGTALVRAAGERRERLVAEFDERVRSFWRAMEFEIRPVATPGRYRGVRN